MLLGALADLVVILHATFLVFVGLGSLLVWRAPMVAWAHVPAVIWGAGMIGVGFECPLTGLEKRLRRAAGEDPYAGGFVDRYIEGVIYPEDFTPVLWALAAAVALVSYAHLVTAGPKPDWLQRITRVPRR